ncbi:mannitol-1-phosphate 5-dehydrogenase [Geobacillus sp. Y412MC52]|uniref:mannitol-1-phosphate 5-dehydrogenase n=1 Tax=Geobacillus sp. (strain Y412MC52) TaxID=550542 RepID=UPI00018C12EF|nr:mannitol-1-phosphate 5-dehydrogenase [Geobacillus sp. Y412MC52]ADU94344.1 Mannitol dehydrogenase domain protein [Geobacillus sp. Y412MC52]
MRAVHFGAGNIGRGFIGSLLAASGYDVVFVDVNEQIVRLLKERGEYRVIVAGEQQEEQWVRGVSALNSQTEREAVIEAIADADLVTTAVGPPILPAIAPVVAAGLQRRFAIQQKPLHVIACENMIAGTEALKTHVFEHLSADEQRLANQSVGFLNCAVDRIVPNQTNDDPLAVTVEPFFEWAIEARNVIGAVPPIQGAHFVADLGPYIERKLFTVNTGHALAAYLGYLRNYETVQEAMNDEDIRWNVEQALSESGAVLVKKHGWDANEHRAYIDTTIGRFMNPSLSDDIIRVARSPIRKLGPNDRLVAPATQYYALFERVPFGLVKGIAALLRFDDASDAEAAALQQTLKQRGVEEALWQYAGLDRGHPLIAAVKEEYGRMEKNKS